jgi:hypothetical protein
MLSTLGSINLIDCVRLLTDKMESGYRRERQTHFGLTSSFCCVMTNGSTKLTNCAKRHG